ncbi:MAG: pitrilysin family protein [Hyphomicrobiales bacterium]
MTLRSPFWTMRAAFAAAVALVGVSATPAAAIDIKEVTSPGGIKAWLVEDHTIPLIAMQFSFKGGVAAEPEAQRGVTNFLAGMLDEGAGPLDSQAFQSREDDLAMKLSFDANLDDFTGSFQTLSRNRDESFELLRLALNEPRFDQAPLEKVRGQIVLGIESDEEDPETIASNAWMKAAFPDHPYSRTTKGTVESVKTITSADLKALSGKLFSRDGLQIAVVGDIKADELATLLDKTFGKLPASSGVSEVAETQVKRGPLVEIIDRDIPQSVMSFGFGGIKRDDPDFIPAYVMNFILGEGGFGSRLMEEVREKRGLTYGIYTSLFPLDRAGAFTGSVSTMNERAKETLDITRKEIARMAKDGPTDKELAEAKTYITGSYPLRFDSNRKIASQLNGIQRQNLGIDYVNRRNALVDAVTVDDVKRVAKRILDADGMIITIVGKPKDVAPQSRT